MKKTRRFLAAMAAAVMAVSTGAVSVSAERSHDLADLDKIVFSVRDYDNPELSVYEYKEFLIDENYNINHAFVWKPTSITVRMKDGSKPGISGDLKLIKLSKYQIKCMQTDNKWSYFYDIDLDITDDLYSIRGFENAEAATSYCTEILKSGKADYAKPISYMEYSVAYPIGAGIADYLKENGVDSTGFSEDLFGFTLTFDNAEEAQSFEPGSIKDFAENLHASAINDNVMYFQLKKEAEGEIMANVLGDLQKTEAIKKIGVMPYSNLESTAETAGEIPGDYPIGDTDYNNSVDIVDVINISKHILGTKKLDELQQLLADYDDNGKVDILDAIKIAKTIMATPHN